MLKLWNTLLLLLLLVLSRSLQSQQRLATAYVSNSSGYVGDQACLPCHQPETSTYFETAHHLTSRMPDQNSILGKFSDGANILRTSSPTIYYQMTANNDGYFESAVEEVSPFQKVSHTERIDIVFGSGRRGPDLSVLEGRPIVRTASQLLDRVGRLDQQSRVSGRFSTLRQTCVAAVSGMPQRTIRTAAAVREFLRPKQLSLRHHLRKVSRSGPRAHAFSWSKDCRKLWNARSDRESRVTSPRPANRYLCFLSCGSRQASHSCPIFYTGRGVGGLRAHSVQTRRFG